MGTNSKHTEGDLFVNYPGHPDNGRIQIGTTKDFIAEMYPHNDNTGGEDSITEEETKANVARLAHCWNCHDDLLEALQTIAECEGNKLDGKDAAGFIVIAKAALKKAKGE